ncbi:MAG: hypothetical protein KDA90_21830 [Planctomycetaceae bacterium]|nr:hypothetical protein [Planctomycetaceae bacterium]
MKQFPKFIVALLLAVGSLGQANSLLGQSQMSDADINDKATEIILAIMESVQKGHDAVKNGRRSSFDVCAVPVEKSPITVKTNATASRAVLATAMLRLPKDSAREFGPVRSRVLDVLLSDLSAHHASGKYPWNLNLDTCYWKHDQMAYVLLFLTELRRKGDDLGIEHWQRKLAVNLSDQIFEDLKKGVQDNCCEAGNCSPRFNCTVHSSCSLALNVFSARFRSLEHESIRNTATRDLDRLWKVDGTYMYGYDKNGSPKRQWSNTPMAHAAMLSFDFSTAWDARMDRPKQEPVRFDYEAMADSKLASMLCREFDKGVRDKYSTDFVNHWTANWTRLNTGNQHYTAYLGFLLDAAVSVYRRHDLHTQGTYDDKTGKLAILMNLNRKFWIRWDFATGVDKKPTGFDPTAMEGIIPDHEINFENGVATFGAGNGSPQLPQRIQDALKTNPMHLWIYTVDQQGTRASVTASPIVIRPAVLAE